MGSVSINSRSAAMIPQTGEYALRAVVHLAKIGGGPTVAQEIAVATKVPMGYLHKILRQLARAEILGAQRGVGGGFTLARIPSAISVNDVLNAVDSGLRRIVRCPLGIPGHMRLCSLHKLIDEAVADVERRFDSTSIADLLASDGPSPLCEDRGTAALSISAASNGRGRPPKE